jgi:hypothetical protein
MNIRSFLRGIFDILTGCVCFAGVLLLPLRALRKLLFGRGISLWAGTPIITIATNCRAERLLGVDARSLVFSTYYITDAFDYNLSRYYAYPVIRRLVPLIVFLWVCIIADRLHFFCDHGILPSREKFTFDFRELRAYKSLGIDVFFWAYGADVRSRSAALAMGDPNACTDCDAPGRYCICDPVKTAENLRELRRLSCALFAGMGDMFGYTPGSIDDLYYWPLDLDASGGEKYRPVYPKVESGEPIKIVHAANHRMFKGTRFLIEAVDQLKAEGCAIDLILVEGRSNAEAMEIYRSADVIFDQCLMGNFGYFALEGMALGKPVMCFIRRPEDYLPFASECPIINTHHSTLKNDIRCVLDSRTELHAFGKRGRAYVEKHFSLAAFAQRLGETYRKLGVQI